MLELNEDNTRCFHFLASCLRRVADWIATIFGALLFVSVFQASRAAIVHEGRSDSQL